MGITKVIPIFMHSNFTYATMKKYDAIAQEKRI